MRRTQQIGMFAEIHKSWVYGEVLLVTHSLYNVCVGYAQSVSYLCIIPVLHTCVAYTHQALRKL